ncbi:MAG: aquaporin [Phycisphaeraceae bacterium]|nr:aquaporin [Phycisphaeraceae bacterium]
MPKYLTEFVGTFFFVLLIALAVNSGSPLAPLFIGLSLSVMVYIGGWISGGHFNPAVSLAATIRGALPVKQFAPYAICQIAGGVGGGLVAALVFGKRFLPAPGKDISIPTALVAEAMFTFLLALVVLNVATVKKVSGNSYFGLAIGMTVAAAAYGAGPICGGAFNPAVALGGYSGTGGAFPAHILYYIVAQLAGGAAAAFFFRIQMTEDSK